MPSKETPNGVVLSDHCGITRSRRDHSVSLHRGSFRIAPTVSFFALGLASFYFLNRSLEGIPLGTAYAVWTGIGAAGTAVLGMVAFNEQATLLQIALIGGLIACIAGLKFVSH